MSNPKMEKRVVDVGFINDADPAELHPRFFPSKVGGKPAWLCRRPPQPAALKCGLCSEPLIFLCQAYAPLDDNEDAFHRTLFVFICRNAACYKPNESANIKVLRCQLRRNNEFYPFEPPDEEKDEPFDDSKCPPLCFVCGGRGPSHCSKCKKVNYCSRSHQIYDWKNGHKLKCCDDNAQANQTSSNKLLFPEFELVIEEESQDNSKKTSVDDELKYLEKLVKEKKAGSLINENENELEAYTNKSVEDKVFSKFKKGISRDPDQVLRYDRGGEPLWISSVSTVTEDQVPNCQYCDGKRQFEFQLMPQLLNFLELEPGVNSIDWGILAVYTCTKSCNDAENPYKNEFIFKQDLVNVPSKLEEDE